MFLYLKKKIFVQIVSRYFLILYSAVSLSLDIALYKSYYFYASPLSRIWSCLLISLYYLLPRSAESRYSFCLIFFSDCWPIFLTPPPTHTHTHTNTHTHTPTHHPHLTLKTLQYFSLKDRLFSIAPV